MPTILILTIIFTTYPDIKSRLIPHNSKIHVYRNRKLFVIDLKLLEMSSFLFNCVMKVPSTVRNYLFMSTFNVPFIL